MVPETIRDGRETVGDISGGKGAGLRSPSPVVKIVKNCKHLGLMSSYHPRNMTCSPPPSPMKITTGDGLRRPAPFPSGISPTVSLPSLIVSGTILQVFLEIISETPETGSGV